MSEAKSRFKIKKGEIEIEFEGTSKEVTDRYKEAFDWVKSLPSREKIDLIEKDAKTKSAGEEKKRGTRGPEIWSPAIDGLINDNFFKLPQRRNQQDVMKALTDTALPVQGRDKVIKQTLVRKVRKGELKGTRGPEGWTFWTESD